MKQTYEMIANTAIIIPYPTFASGIIKQPRNIARSDLILQEGPDDLTAAVCWYGLMVDIPIKTLEFTVK